MIGFYNVGRFRFKMGVRCSFLTQTLQDEKFHGTKIRDCLLSTKGSSHKSFAELSPREIFKNGFWFICFYGIYFGVSVHS